MNKKILYLFWSIYLLCFFAYLFNSELVVIYGVATTLVQSITAFIASSEYLRVYKKSKDKSFLYFALTFLVLSVADLTYGTFVNIKMLSDLRNTQYELFYSIPYVLFWVLGSCNINRITKPLSKRFKFIHYSVFAIGTFIFFYNYSGVIYTDKLVGLNRMIHILGIVSKVYIVTASLFLFLTSRLYYVQYLSGGYLFLIAYSLVLEYLEITNNMIPGLPSEIFWSVGVLFLYKSAVNVQRDNDVIIQGKLIDMNSVRTRIILLGFSFQLLGIAGWVSFDKIITTMGAPRFGLMVLWACVMIPLFWLFSFRASKIIIRPLELIHQKLTTISDLQNNSKIDLTGITEYDNILVDADKLVTQIREQHLGYKKLSDLAAQMSHDIRSPLTALKLLSTQNVNASDKYKMMMDQVVSRIHNIADTLLAARKGEIFDEKQLCMPFIIVESILAEKKISCRSDITFEFIPIGESKLQIANFSKEKLEAIISNILNNALDAFELNKNISNPTVSVYISCHDTAIKVSIQDNAGGMPREVVEKINARQSVSTKEHGNGIGLQSAKKELDAVGGSLDLISEMGFGTVFDITVPAFKEDDIFTLSIFSDSKTKLVSIDDDYSIHILWKEKLKNSFEIVCFSDPEVFLAEQTGLNDDCIYLVDYEFRKATKTGLDIIKLINNPKKCYLVTSRYYEKKIVEQAKRDGFKIIPKPLAHFVEFKTALS